MVTPEFFATVIRAQLPEPHASLLNGIILGLPVKFDQTLYQQLKEVGIIHIAVLSGSNINLLTNMISQLVRPLGVKVASCISIIGIISFIFFVGAEPPLIRAGCMSILTLIARIFGRKTMSLYLLFVSALIISIFWPDWLRTVSFQLSFAATLGIILASHTRQKTTNIQKKSKLLQTYLNEELKISLAAQLFTTPIIFFYFKQISFIAPVTNVLISWTIAPLMVFGLATAILGKIHYMLGYLPGLCSYTLLSYIIFIVKLLAQVPFGFLSF